MPGPRKLFAEERFALSYEALKMKGTFSLPVISLRRPAISWVRVSPSMTQGPAIRNRGRSMPTWKLASCTGTSESELRRIHVPARGPHYPDLSCRTRPVSAVG
jgi:hypothetical protein